MNRFIVSTVRRHCPPDEPSGYVYVIDPDAHRVIQRSAILEPLFRDLDNNPRGGMRGGKGISVRPDQIAMANFSMIFRYDPQWKLLGAITHPSCAGIHDIMFDGDALWTAAARADLLACFSLDGGLTRHYYLREPSAAVDDLGWRAPVLLNDEIITRGRIDFRHPREVEKETYDRAHLNSLCRLNSGDLLVSLGFVFDARFAGLLRLKIRLVQWGIWPALKSMNKTVRRALGRGGKNMDQSLMVKPAQARSALVRLLPNGERRLCLELNKITAPSHSLLALPDDTVIYLNTTDGSLLHVEPYAGQVLSSTTAAENGFLRGVTQMNERTLLVGSRGDLIIFDLPGRCVHDRFPITNDPNEAVYDIKALPEHYTLPPLSFAEDFSRQTGLTGPAALLKR